MEHSISSLIEMSDKRNFEMEDLPWHMEVDKEKPWIPSSVDPVQYLPSYKLLSSEEQLLINQYYGAGMCEKFIFFEFALCIALEVLLKKKKDLPEDFREIAEIFLKEEIKHSKMFNALANKALPQKYKGKDYYFLTNNYKIWLANNVIFKNPEFFVYWIWLGVYFEEKTIVFSQEYIRGKNQVDPLFYKIHKMHLQDEARHVEIDKHLLKYFYDGSSMFKKNLAKKMFASTVKSIQVPKRTLFKIYKEVQKDLNIKNVSTYNKLLVEIEDLPKNKDYMDVVFAKKRFPVFNQLLESREVMSSLKGHFV